jgi:ABC-type uncharacterized transport system ATPase subunit
VTTRSRDEIDEIRANEQVIEAYLGRGLKNRVAADAPA